MIRCVLLCVNYLDGEKRDVCFAFFVFLVPRECCVAFPHGDTGVCLQFVIVVFPDHTHLLF